MMYVFVKKFEDGSELASIVEDPIALFKNGEYNESRGDRLYQLGQEVTVETAIKVTSKPTYRGPQADTFKLSFPHGLKGDLGVGDYRG
jgi:hypothetical protein